jgi:hypothetical protein
MVDYYFEIAFLANKSTEEIVSALNKIYKKVAGNKNLLERMGDKLFDVGIGDGSLYGIDKYIGSAGGYEDNNTTELVETGVFKEISDEIMKEMKKDIIKLEHGFNLMVDGGAGDYYYCRNFDTFVEVEVKHWWRFNVDDETVDELKNYMLENGMLKEDGTVELDITYDNSSPEEGSKGIQMHRFFYSYCKNKGLLTGSERTW